MGIGIVLLFGLGFVVALSSVALIGLRNALKIADRGKRRRRLAVYLVIGLIGISPILRALYAAFGPPPDPMNALAEIFPQPLPSGIKPMAAADENSSDYWSYYIEIKADAQVVDALRNSRGMKAEVDPREINFRLPTNVRSPDFWPRENCTGLVLYRLEEHIFNKLPPPRTWQGIRLFYCPKEQTVFVWAVDVD
jgi:hypothetical protein